MKALEKYSKSKILYTYKDQNCPDYSFSCETIYMQKLDLQKQDRTNINTFELCYCRLLLMIPQKAMKTTKQTIEQTMQNFQLRHK